MSASWSQQALLNQELLPFLRVELTNLNNDHYRYFIRSILATDSDLLSLLDKDNHLDSWTPSLFKNASPELIQITDLELEASPLSAFLLSNTQNKAQKQEVQEGQKSKEDKESKGGKEVTLQQAISRYLYQVKMPAFALGWVLEREYHPQASTTAEVDTHLKEADSAINTPPKASTALAKQLVAHSATLKNTLESFVQREIDLRLYKTYLSSTFNLEAEQQKDREIKQAFVKFTALLDNNQDSFDAAYYLQQDLQAKTLSKYSLDAKSLTTTSSLNIASNRLVVDSFPTLRPGNNSSQSELSVLYHLCQGESLSILTPYLPLDSNQDQLAQDQLLALDSDLDSNLEHLVFLMEEAKKTFYRQLNLPALERVLNRLALPQRQVMQWVKQQSWGFFIFASKYLTEILEQEAQQLVELNQYSKSSSSREIIAYTVLGYGDVYLEINNLAVNPNFRGLGISNLLMQAIIHLGSKLAVNNIELEVRESNQAAIALYRKFGFKPWKVLENYYATSSYHQGQGENALAMSLSPEPLSLEGVANQATQNPEQRKNKVIVLHQQEKLEVSYQKTDLTSV